MSDLAIVLALLAAAIVMFAINKPRMDAVALIMLTALPFTGVLTMGEALAGFSDPNIVLIAALFVIGDGLVRTGVARRLGDWLTAKAGSSETRLLVLLMLVVCGLGATMSSTAVTAIFIPVALRIAQSTGTSPSRLMMPLSFAALISGMTTLIATAPNLVVNSELVRHGVEGFHFFSFTPFGLPVLVLGIVYMLFARRWLAATTSEVEGSPADPSLADWIEEYKLAGREHRVRVTDRSPLVGKTLAELRPARHVRRKHRRHRARPASSPESCADREDGAAGRRHPARRPVRSATPTSRRFGSNTRWKRCRSAAPTSPTARRRSAWRRSSCRPTSDLIGKTVVEAEFRDPLRADGDRPAARRRRARAQPAERGAGRSATRCC